MDNLAEKNSTLATVLDRLGESIKKRQPTSSRDIHQHQLIPTTNIVQLPLWNDALRGVPNDLVRSALFRVGNRAVARANFKKEKIASIGSINITYTGEELRQDDKDVLMQIFHFSRLSPLGNKVYCTSYKMVKELDWPINGKSYTKLETHLERLKATSLVISTEDRGYSGSLILNYAWEGVDRDRKLALTLDPNIISLFGHTTYTQIYWEQRKQLTSLAKWLHSFYSSHAEPYAYKTSTIRELSGSKTNDLSKFRQLIRSALTELKEVGFLRLWHIDDFDNINVIRSNSN